MLLLVAMRSIKEQKANRNLSKVKRQPSGGVLKRFSRHVSPWTSQCWPTFPKTPCGIRLPLRIFRTMNTRVKWLSGTSGSLSSARWGSTWKSSQKVAGCSTSWHIQSTATKLSYSESRFVILLPLLRRTDMTSRSTDNNLAFLMKVTPQNGPELTKSSISVISSLKHRWMSSLGP